MHFDIRKYTKGNSAGARTLISTFSCRSTCTLVFFIFTFFYWEGGGGGGGGRGQSRTRTYIFTAAGGLHHHYVKSRSGKVLYRKAV